MVIWIIGLSGSGKTYLAKKLIKKIKGKTILIDGLIWSECCAPQKELGRARRKKQEEEERIEKAKRRALKIEKEKRAKQKEEEEKKHKKTELICMAKCLQELQVFSWV